LAQGIYAFGREVGRGCRGVVGVAHGFRLSRG
jgi:hypothetical protein